MAKFVILVVIFTLVLLLAAYLSRRQLRQYETKKVKDTLSETMKAMIRRERRENLAKKQRFEAVLKEADQVRLEGEHKEDTPDSSRG